MRKAKVTKHDTTVEQKPATTAPSIPAELNGIDLTKLSVAQLKELLKTKRQIVASESHKESREQKIGRLAAYAFDCEAWAQDDQERLDKAIARADAANTSLAKHIAKYGFTAEQVQSAKMAYLTERAKKTAEFKAKQAAATKGKK